MDPIVFATKGKVLLNLVREGEPWAMSARSRKGPMSERFRSPDRLSAEGRYPKTLVSDGAAPFEYFAGSRQPRGEVRVHPNQKPLWLMQWIIAKVPGRILDPFAGGGTTLAAARAEGRQSVGIELDADHCAAAAKRLGPNPTAEASPGQAA